MKLQGCKHKGGLGRWPLKQSIMGWGCRHQIFRCMFSSFHGVQDISIYMDHRMQLPPLINNLQVNFFCHAISVYLNPGIVSTDLFTIPRETSFLDCGEIVGKLNPQRFPALWAQFSVRLSGTRHIYEKVYDMQEHPGHTRHRKTDMISFNAFTHSSYYTNQTQQLEWKQMNKQL